MDVGGEGRKRMSRTPDRTGRQCVERRSLRLQWLHMNTKYLVFGGLSGAQSALDTCSITEACYWVAISNLFSRSVALAVERRSFYSIRLLCKYHQGDVEVMSSNVVGPRLTHFLGTTPAQFVSRELRE